MATKNSTQVIDISVVIGFRDWGAERIRMATQSIQASFGKYKGEVIISDYGSADPEPAKAVAELTGAKYVYTPGDPVWSRSRALNAGFAIAEGKILVSTDADMLFSPESFSTIVEIVNEKKNVALFLQCRDLPQGMSAEELLQREVIDWRELEVAGRMRPRWGMGGMMAIHRDGMNAIRGFDERLHTYGGEDLDFAQRARRAGYKTVWIDDERVRMYHMWHEPSRAIAVQTEESKAAVEYNKTVVYHDKTGIRNTLEWANPLADAPPLVTVSIVTFNRADLIGETIRSVLMQSVQDFEIIVVDDGSTDNTREVIESFNDDRIRYIWQENAGISAARNRAVQMARGQFIAVQDDDDLMHPNRLEWQLESITEGVSGSVGSFVNFSNETGETAMSISQIPSLTQLVDDGSNPGHGTWMIRTDLFKAIPYDENLTSGVDHNILVRMIRSGAQIVHCAKPIMLRRQHSKQVTVTDGVSQSDSAVQSLRFLRFDLSAAQIEQMRKEYEGSYYPHVDDKDEYLEMILPFLPDHLVKRRAWASFDEKSISNIKKSTFEGEISREIFRSSEGEDTYTIFVENATQQDLVKLAQLGTKMDAEILNEEEAGSFSKNISSHAAKSTFRLRFGAQKICAVYPTDHKTSEKIIKELEGTDVPWTSFHNDKKGMFVCDISGIDKISVNPWLVFGATPEELAQ